MLIQKTSRISLITAWCIVLQCMIPSFSLADGRVTTLKSGQVAPFAGTLLDNEASASWLSEKQKAVEICEARIIEAKGLCEAKSKYDTSLLQLQLDAERTKNIAVTKAKDERIQGLEKLYQPPAWYENPVVHFAAGTVVGALVFFGAASALSHVVK